MGIEQGPKLPIPEPDSSSDSSPTDRREFLKKVGIGAAGLVAGAGITSYLASDKAVDQGPKHEPQEGLEEVELDELQEKAAAALSEWMLPDFKDDDPKKVSKSFKEAAFSDPEHAKKWFSHFSERVRELSNSQVSLREVNEQERKEFRSGARGPAKYLFLTKQMQKVRIIFGPYETPFTQD